MDEYFRWTKGDHEKLSPHFSTDEFTCPCKNAECADQMIAMLLIEKLQKLRDLLGDPITITSGFRCGEHQAELTARGCETARGVSQHELGHAADILSSQFQKLADLVPKEFKAIGYSNRFLHVDLRAPKERIWKYIN